ncbi:MAG TPA: hypothetical protein VNS63_02465 [Blastocatellia bacterium]|nr:hypothetical protein [Blastocatellia bacterium]
MIPILASLAERWGMSAGYLPIVLAGLFTAFVLLVQSVAGWFVKQDP